MHASSPAIHSPIRIGSGIVLLSQRAFGEPPSFARGQAAALFRLNHYFTKSREEISAQG